MKRVLCAFAVSSLLLLGCQGQQQETEKPAQTGEEAGQQGMQTEPEQQAGSQMAGGGEQGQPMEQGGQPTGEEGALPPAEGQAFVQYITKENPYKQWELWPGKGEMYPGTQPHGAFLTTYVNQPALQAIQQKSGQMPEGAIVVKENYSPDKELGAVTAMYKKAGFNPQAGDWYWIKFSPDGQVEAEGKVEGCIGCHRRAEANDWIFTGNFGKQGS